MHITDLQQTVKQPALLASLSGLINPATIIPLASIGLVSFVVFKVTRSLKGNERLETASEAVKRPIETVPYREIEPLRTVSSSGSEALDAEETIKKEMVRQVMSEMGKRSGRVRRLNRKTN